MTVRTESVVPIQVHATGWLHNPDVTRSGDGSELFFPYQELGRMELGRMELGRAVPSGASP